MYKIYLTDSLYCIANTLRAYCGGEGKAIQKRFSEIAYTDAKVNKKIENTEELSNDIINNIKKKLGG